MVFRRVEKISMLIGSYLENSRYFSCFLALCNVGPSSWVLASARCGRRARGGPPSRLRRSAARRAPARPSPRSLQQRTRAHVPPTQEAPDHLRSGASRFVVRPNGTADSMGRNLKASHLEQMRRRPRRSRAGPSAGPLVTSRIKLSPAPRRSNHGGHTPPRAWACYMAHNSRKVLFVLSLRLKIGVSVRNFGKRLRRAAA